jgi:Flp pilus assembly protein TadD
VSEADPMATTDHTACPRCGGPLSADDADTHFNLGATLEHQGKLEEAVAELRTAIRLKPEFAKAHLNLGSSLGPQGKLDEAVVELRNARDKAQPGSQLSQLIEHALATVH